MIRADDENRLVMTLPDGSQKEYPQPVDGFRVAESIGKRLLKDAVAIRVNGDLQDLSDAITENADVAIITAKDDEGVHIIRHSCAHLLAHALTQLFPDAKMVIGPVIENGFYYDIACEHRFSPDDLLKIEKRMHELADTAYRVKKVWTDVEEAREIFTERGQDYKVRLIDDFDDSVKKVGLYYHEEYVDMCRGPHVPNMSFTRVFKLTKLAGSYWRGDAENEQLQRIYGVAFADKKELSAYLKQMEEAEKRDHRKLGRKLDLFHFQEEAPGMVFWHPYGLTLYRCVENFMRDKLREYGYEEVMAPQILDRSLWEKSGHWDKFGTNMFTTSIDEHDYAIKPMNCPGHIQIFNQGLKSYRDLPIRMAEFGVVHRNEPSGTLHGLMRARRFTQDDAHIFCTHEQIRSETEHCIDMVFDVYHSFGFDQIELALSTRPEQRVGSDEVWDRSEQALQEALDAKGLSYRVQPGEGAFYGPKIEFTLKDSIGRRWQCGTVQLDFSMPGRLSAFYIDEHGEKQVPVMIHRAILGSLERFVGVLIEQCAGFLPVWLAPRQVVVMGISDAQADYVKKVCDILLKKGFRVEKDLRNEKINYKIRELTLQRVPYMLVVGQREVEAGTVSVRTRGGKDLQAMKIDDFCAYLQKMIDDKSVGE